MSAAIVFALFAALLEFAAIMLLRGAGLSGFLVVASFLMIVMGGVLTTFAVILAAQNLPSRR